VKHEERGKNNEQKGGEEERMIELREQIFPLEQK
jgi:hypothetical protein